MNADLLWTRSTRAQSPATKDPCLPRASQVRTVSSPATAVGETVRLQLSSHELLCSAFVKVPCAMAATSL